MCDYQIEYGKQFSLTHINLASHTKRMLGLYELKRTAHAAIHASAHL